MNEQKLICPERSTFASCQLAEPEEFEFCMSAWKSENWFENGPEEEKPPEVTEQSSLEVIEYLQQDLNRCRLEYPSRVVLDPDNPCPIQIKVSGQWLNGPVKIYHLTSVTLYKRLNNSQQHFLEANCEGMVIFDEHGISRKLQLPLVNCGIYLIDVQVDEVTRLPRERLVT
ncbi:hypothetical protein Ciccas_012113 [Cichlidogyrus casuarinus]|uniref:Uncharacterized protein n=1 Tax=Cichlidogyrus casuarinus TaxID=1844966 RepID=A0ABD2PSD3_9PLAT